MTLAQPGSDERRCMRPNNDQTTTAARRRRRADDRREQLVTFLPAVGVPLTRGHARLKWARGPEGQSQDVVFGVALASLCED